MKEHVADPPVSFHTLALTIAGMEDALDTAHGLHAARAEQETAQRAQGVTPNAQPGP